MFPFAVLPSPFANGWVSKPNGAPKSANGRTQLPNWEPPLPNGRVSIPNGYTKLANGKGLWSQGRSFLVQRKAIWFQGSSFLVQRKASSGQLKGSFAQLSCWICEREGCSHARNNHFISPLVRDCIAFIYFEYQNPHLVPRQQLA